MDKTLLSTSFIQEANHSLFPIQHLPYGVFRPKNSSTAPRIGTAIGPYVLDLACLEQYKLLPQYPISLFAQDNLNVFSAQGQSVWLNIRRKLQSLLDINSKDHELKNNNNLLSKALIPQDQVDMLPPFKTEGFSDFYASEHHASNVGKLFRGKENALLPNWKHLPVGYHGRTSTIFNSGTSIKRPKGQIKLASEDFPIFSPTQKLDFELELGIFVGIGNEEGHPISIEKAPSHIFGLVLLNDWSARDIQAFEYQPLGPFLSKSFATSISPWVVSLAALEHFMVPLPKQDPEPVSYLKQDLRKQPDIKLKVEIQPKGSTIKTTICETNSKELYWTMEQMLAHHTINHCIMKPGDLLGTGTISGEKKSSWGSLLEITLNGSEAIQLTDGRKRAFLEDGDTIFITGYCESEHYKIGFGCLEGTILSAD
jgi:fumarylacetoacetase